MTITRAPKWPTLLAFVAIGSTFPAISFPAVLQVGPHSEYTKPSDVAKVAKDGDIIEIAEGTWRNGNTVWRQDNLTIRGFGGRAHLKADGTLAEGKAIWVVKGKNTTIENIEFSGARVKDQNGAGIRQEGTNLIY